MTHYLPLYFPEMGKFWNSTRSEWWINFLLHFPTTASITQHAEQEFCALAFPIIGRKVNIQSKLQEHYATAQNSTGLPVAPDSLTCQTFKLKLQRYQEITFQRQQLEHKAESILNTHPDYRIVIAIPSIGPIIALTILAEGGDLHTIDNFSNTAAWIWPRTNRVISAAKTNFLSEEMLIYGDWIGLYNQKRPHQALRMKTPKQIFEMFKMFKMFKMAAWPKQKMMGHYTRKTNVGKI